MIRERQRNQLEFIHYVERLHQNLGGGHGAGPAAPHAH